MQFIALSDRYLFQSTRPGRSATLPEPAATADPQGFNPRAPGGARLGSAAAASAMVHVSIHAPRAERDLSVCLIVVLMLSFNPRAPGGARRLRHRIARNAF